MTFTHALSTNNYGPSKFIVDASAANGTHTTIASALTSASSGDTIFIRPGTYTENLTLKAGVDLSAFECDALTPNVTIAGTCTSTTAGTVSISGIRLQTNSAFLLAVTGSANSVVNLKNCFLNMTNNTGISYTSSGASSGIRVLDCYGDIGTSGISIFTVSGTGVLPHVGSGLLFSNTIIANSGNSTTASTSSATYVQFIKCKFYTPFTTSSAGSFSFYHTDVENQNNNATSVTLAGTGTSYAEFSEFTSGTATAITIGAGTVFSFFQNIVSSSNTAAISGAGTLQYANLSFVSSSNITVTTQTLMNSGPSATFGSTNTGLVNTFLVTNSSNTASSGSAIVANVAGSTAADAVHQSTITSGQSWTWGLDNSDSDAFVIASSAALGTTNVMRVATTGEVTFPLQSAFSAYAGSTATDATGDGTTVAPVVFGTEIFDVNGDFATNTYTCPVTAKVQLNAAIYAQQAVATMSVSMYFATSNNTYQGNTATTTVTGVVTFSYSVLADMDAGDTASVGFVMSNGTKVVDLYGAGGDPRTIFNGYIAC